MHRLLHMLQRWMKIIRCRHRRSQKDGMLHHIGRQMFQCNENDNGTGTVSKQADWAVWMSCVIFQDAGSQLHPFAASMRIIDLVCEDSALSMRPGNRDKLDRIAI